MICGDHLWRAAVLKGPEKVLNASFRNTGKSFFRTSNDSHNITAGPGLVLKCLSEMTVNTINNLRVDTLVQHRIYNYVTYNTNIFVNIFFKSLVNKDKTILGKNIYLYTHTHTHSTIHTHPHPYSEYGSSCLALCIVISTSSNTAQIN